MANYRIPLKVGLPQEKLFTYLTTLSYARDWEPSVAGARDENTAALGIGSSFDLEIRARKRTRPFTYKIVEFEPPQRAVLEAITRAFYSRITINVLKIDDETSEMNFESALRRRGFSAIFNGILYFPMRRIGKRAHLNLERVLTGR
ncbi:MAG TPA: hypothetical protein VNE42_12330 [Acidimicrobiales bacterium]|nr:hypothetical protein [Acidimicrobiales bacterium]